MSVIDAVERLVAIDAIKVLKARYFRLLDTRDWNGWSQLFAEQCRIYCQPDPDAVIVGREAFVDFVRAGITPGVSVHHGHMPEIELLDPSTAVGTWAMADIVRTEGRAPSLDLSGWGHYHERYERGADGEWRIAELRLTRLLVDDHRTVISPEPSPTPAYRDLRDRTATGVFGEADALGCLNHLTPERVVAAAGLVRRGDVYSLNAPVDWPSPALFGRGDVDHHVLVTKRGNHDDYLDRFYPQASSQWDGFLHIRTGDGAFYNDLPREGAGIEHWARRGIVGRGVLLDVAAWRESVGRPLHWRERDDISADDLRRCRAVQGVAAQPGDILLIRTGWTAGYQQASTDEREELARTLPPAAPGLADTEEMAELLWDWPVAAVAADNPALEAWPPDGPGLHDRLLPRLGIPIGELWWLDALAAACAADGVYDFLLTAAPLHVVGGVGSPANALAIR